MNDSMVVWKYTLGARGAFSKTELQIPCGAEIIDFRLQCDQFCIWVLCNPINVTEKRWFVVRPTGAEWDPLVYTYLWTCHIVSSLTVWHLTERIVDKT